jgi:hypothetical protein
MEILNQNNWKRSFIFFAIMILFCMISFNAFHETYHNIISEIIYNHININNEGFHLFKNYYYNLSLSIGYLLLINIFLFFIGKYAAAKREIISK